MSVLSHIEILRKRIVILKKYSLANDQGKLTITLVSSRKRAMVAITEVVTVGQTSHGVSCV